VDIRGTLWIDRRTKELQYLEFSYDRLTVNAPRESAGGEMYFARLPTGMWIITSWTINAPVVIVNRRLPPPNNSTLTSILRVSQRVLDAHVDRRLVYEAKQ
jgi:hypothetical protein